MDNDIVTITKNNEVFLNFDKPVGALMIAKICELLDIIHDDVSKNTPDVVVMSEGNGKIKIRK